MKYLVVTGSTKTACIFNINANVLVKLKAQFFSHFIDDLGLAYGVEVVCVLLGVPFHSTLKVSTTFNVFSHVSQNLAKVFARGHAVFNDLAKGSGGIGWGLAASVGAALGCGKRQVVAVIGDGSSLYASEALWTAAHHGTKILLVVLSNRRYATLNAAAGKLAGGALASFTIEPPVLDFSGLAKLYGWHHLQAATGRELDAGLDSLGSSLKANTLLELKLDPALQPVTASRHF